MSGACGPAFGAEPGPRIIAHRGGAGLGPENTLAACERSLALGVGHLEVDLRVTADNVCVALHDADLRRAAGHPVAVRDLTWAELARRTVFGSGRVPRLEDLLAAHPDALFVLDLKDRRVVPGLARALRAARAGDRVCLAGTDDDLLADARAVLGPGVAAATGWRATARLVAAARTGTRRAGLLTAPFVHVPLRLGRVPVFGGRLVPLAHDLGAAVHVWTVDRPADMHRLLDAGVDGIITDRPDLAREVLLARDLWRPHAAPLTGAR